MKSNTKHCPAPHRNQLLQNAILLAALLLSGCSIEHETMHDPVLQLQAEDYRAKLTAPAPDTALPETTPPDAEPAPIATAPLPAPSPALQKSVSLNITNGVPLRDLLLELARQAGLDADIDPAVEGALLMSVQNRPLQEVLDQIAARIGLRYSVNNRFLRVERDLPYVQDYRLDFLNAVRDSQGSIGISTDVFGAVAKNGSGGSTGDNGSKSKITSKSLADPFESLESNLNLLLSERNLPKDGDKTDAPPKPYSLNRQAGLLSVTGTEVQQQRVQRFLAMLHRQTMAQVLIEAKVVEVGLKDEYKSGINWRRFATGSPAVNGSLGLGATLTDGINPGFVTLSLTDKDFAGVLGFLGRFGTTRTLSNPRLTVMNNQNAILKVAQNQVYFTLDYERRQGKNGDPDTVSVGSQLYTVPIGLVMSVQPAINPESQNITMTLRPTISRITGFVNDPAVAIASNNTVTSTIPVVEVRELDSVLHLKSGEAMVMGGLMQDRATNVKEGVPGLKDSAPAMVSPLVSAKDDMQEVVELVIFLRATLIPDALNSDTLTTDSALGTPVGKADAALYQNFTRDPRPLNFPNPNPISQP
jgi:general secretion pathway protein D